MNPLVSFCAVTFIMRMITTIKMMMMMTMSVTMVVVIMTTRSVLQKTSCHISWRVWWVNDKLPWTPKQDVQGCFQPELFCSVLREEKLTLMVPFQTRSIKRPWGLKKSAYNLNERVLERSGGENSCPCIITRSIVRIVCIYYAHMGGAAIQPCSIIDIIANPL